MSRDPVPDELDPKYRALWSQADDVVETAEAKYRRNDVPAFVLDRAKEDRAALRVRLLHLSCQPPEPLVVTGRLRFAKWLVEQGHLSEGDGLSDVRLSDLGVRPIGSVISVPSVDRHGAFFGLDPHGEMQ